MAVASGPYIFVYKNLRPYFKFTLPSLLVDAQEELLWDQIREVGLIFRNSGLITDFVKYISSVFTKYFSKCGQKKRC